MNKRILAIVGGLLLLSIVAGGSFYGGILFQQRQAANIRAQFFGGRNGGAGDANGGGGFGGGFFGAGGGNGAGGRGAFGQIKSIDGDILTVSTPQREIKVQITDSTLFRKVVDGQQTDLTVGTTITVRGQTDSNGNVTADSIQIDPAAQNPGP